MAKLTTAQSSIIERLKNGEKIAMFWTVSPYCSFLNWDDKKINWNTIFKLEELKLIKRDTVNKTVTLI